MYPIGVMKAAGFRYIGVGNTARCDICGLEVHEWPSNMQPATIHEKLSPTCPFIRLSLLARLVSVPTVMPFTSFAPAAHDSENSSKRKEAASSTENYSAKTLREVEALVAIRRRSFLSSSQETFPRIEQMVEAGFFCCNVGDRVICFYCKIVCQEWIIDRDFPWEVHKTLSPECPYVIATLKKQQTSSVDIVNGTPDTAAPRPAPTGVDKRQSTFSAWKSGERPSDKDFAGSGFVYTGTETVVTCFYCNGSLKNWAKRDNPIIEHARWFPNCAYAKQKCGEELHRNIQTNAQHVKGISEYFMRIDKSPYFAHSSGARALHI